MNIPFHFLVKNNDNIMITQQIFKKSTTLVVFDAKTEMVYLPINCLSVHDPIAIK